MLLVRVANWRFLAVKDPAGPATFLTNARKAEAALKSLVDLDAAGTYARSIAAVREALNFYRMQFEATSRAMLAEAELFDQAARPKFEAIDAAGIEARHSIEESVTELSAATAAAGTARITLIGLATAVAALGVTFALLLARGIIGPIRGMTGAMSTPPAASRPSR